MTRKKDALVTFKTCPRCKGMGQVPCDGKEPVRKEQGEWAYSYNMKPVSFQCWDGTVVAGLAVPQLLPGGYYHLKIYIKVTKPPDSLGYAYKITTDGRAKPLFNAGEVALFEWDEINGKAFWPVTCRYEDRDKLQLLDYWPESIAIEDIKLLGLADISL